MQSMIIIIEREKFDSSLFIQEIHTASLSASEEVTCFNDTDSWSTSARHWKHLMGKQDSPHEALFVQEIYNRFSLYFGMSEGLQRNWFMKLRKEWGASRRLTHEPPVRDTESTWWQSRTSHIKLNLFTAWVRKIYCLFVLTYWREQNNDGLVAGEGEG